MSWKKRAIIDQDVVFFSYLKEDDQKRAQLVYIWDLDKTYLETHFESIKGLIKTAFEKAFQKQNVPGTKSIIQALVSDKASFSNRFPIYFVSASPPQMEEKISEKLKIDGILPSGMCFKDNLKNLTPKRFWRLNQQLGYKLHALLLLRLKLHPKITQILWGDDSETDAMVYSLYSDICARRLVGKSLQIILSQLKVVDEQIFEIEELQKNIPTLDPVEKIYINLALDTDPQYYLKFGRRTLPTYDSFQVAIDLFQDDRLGIENVIKVAMDMLKNYGFSSDQLIVSFNDMLERKLLSKKTVEEILPQLIDKKIFPYNYKIPHTPTENLKTIDGKNLGIEGAPGEWIPEVIDYLHDLR